MTSRGPIPTVKGWSGLRFGDWRTPKLNQLKHLHSLDFLLSPGRRSARMGRLRPGRSAGLWPDRFSGPQAHLRLSLLLLIFTLQGCGGATAPCPTPTTELDQLRERSARLESEMEEATRAESGSEEEREEALRRLAGAQAALDSIADARNR